LDAETVAYLTSEEGLLELNSILLYHVVPGTILSTDLTDGGAATTAQGSDVNISLANGPMVNDANIVTPDVLASNGVIHVIDKVILPPANVPEPVPTAEGTTPPVEAPTETTIPPGSSQGLVRTEVTWSMSPNDGVNNRQATDDEIQGFVTQSAAFMKDIFDDAFLADESFGTPSDVIPTLVKADFSAEGIPITILGQTVLHNHVMTVYFEIPFVNAEGQQTPTMGQWIQGTGFLTSERRSEFALQYLARITGSPFERIGGPAGIAYGTQINPNVL
jgi:Fasciclin domain